MQPPNQTAVGVNLGGTKIAAALFDASGRRLSELCVAPTEAHGPREGTIANLFAIVRRVLAASGEAAQPAGIGVGSTGPLDPVAGLFLEPAKLPALFHFPLRAALAGEFGLPVALTNDGNAFALGEALFGAGKGHGIVVGVTLGTGCGCGIVVEGRVLEGATANSGEVYKAPLAGGNFDALLSGGGLERLYAERAGREAPGAEVHRLAAAGDPAAREAFAAVGAHLAQGVGLIAAIVDPGVIVLGGSVSRGFEYFAPTLRRELGAYVAPQVAATLKIAPSAVGDVAGALGAAALVFSGRSIR